MIGHAGINTDIKETAQHMSLSIQYLSFFVIQTDGEEAGASKHFKHFQTLDGEAYDGSELKSFLDSEFIRILKRKVERNPGSENAPTKIGRFEVEPGHELTANPNYNLLQRLRTADNREQFLGFADEVVRVYMDTSSVRGGALIAATATMNTHFDEPFVFLMKCDFEPKIARISDERSLISHVEMAISARNIKSIQYPHMPEEGMIAPWELKIHQASHARYFEDFLKYVSYDKPLPELMNEQILGMVYQHMEEKWQDTPHDDELRQEDEQKLEFWAASDKRDIQERWTHETVTEAAAQLIEHKPDLGFGFKLDGVAVKGLLADYGNKIHFTKHNGKYVVMLEGDSFQFDRGMSPVELLHPDPLETVLDRIGKSSGIDAAGYAGPENYARDAAAAASEPSGSDRSDDDVPWD